MKHRVLQRLISREYRHLRVWAGVRLAAGLILVILGVLLLSIGRYAWTVVLLAAAALHFWLSYEEMTMARSGPPRS